MAERQNAPSQSDQASNRSKPEGERDRDPGGDTERDQPYVSGRDHLDPIELRDIRDETSERHRRGEDIGASGISNPTLAEEEEEQAELPPSNTRKASNGT